MTDTLHLIDEHNSACERARFSNCNCYCHGAGHQLDLLMRAVSCTDSGENNMTQLLSDLSDVYGGFHGDLRDGDTPSRRSVPDDLAQMNLDRGRGATWAEGLLLDEALHSAFIDMARASVLLSDAERTARLVFVKNLAEGALRIVGRDVDAHNISDGHLWCSILAESMASLPAAASAPPPTTFGRICYPRMRAARGPQALPIVRTPGFTYVSEAVSASALPAKENIMRLMGAASCPDLWHHPAAVRYSLLPFVTASSWPPPETTTIAVQPGINVLEARWEKRRNW
jgi:hypothetical protein